MQISPEVIKTAQALAEHTGPRCGGKTCYRNQEHAPKHRCCSEMYCEITKFYASDLNVDLPQVRNEGLLYMGAQGCTVPPHLRPLCTLHDCQINSLGFDPEDPEWTEKYFELREKYENAGVEADQHG